MVNEKSIKALVKHNIKKLILKNIKNKKQQKQLINTVDKTVNNLSIEELKTKGIIKKIYDNIQDEHVIVGGMLKRPREEGAEEVDIEPNEQEKRQKAEADHISTEKIYAPGPPDKISTVSKQPKTIPMSGNLQKIRYYKYLPFIRRRSYQRGEQPNVMAIPRFNEETTRVHPTGKQNPTKGDFPH